MIGIKEVASLLSIFLWTGAVAAADPGVTAPDRELAREIFRELIEIDTTDATGNTTKAAEAVASRLLRAGYSSEDVRVVGPHPRKGNLVARLRGSGKERPILLLAHLDVVAARREDWSMDPFKFIEKEGFFHGRGTTDNKAGAALLVANFIRWKTQGFRPKRDLVLALTADEEGGEHNGVQWLLEHHRPLIDASYCLNTDGGGGELKDGRPRINEVQLAEKIYLSFRLEVKNRGGHSSLPTKQNAIYQLASGLTRLSRFEFPIRLNPITRAYFQRIARFESGQMSQDMKRVAAGRVDSLAIARLSSSPYYNALLRTTCVATLLEAGHAENALPQTAAAVVNCRLLPEDSPDEVRRTIVRVVADESVTVSPIATPQPSAPTALSREVLAPIERITNEIWPGVPVVPILSTGATDGLFLRRAGIPVYGVSGLFGDVEDVRAHGRDERVGVKAFFDALDFMDRLVRSLASIE